MFESDKPFPIHWGFRSGASSGRRMESLRQERTLMIFVLSRGEFDTVSGKVKRFDKARQIVCQSAVFPMRIRSQS